jgi:hypothetical protein
MIRTVRAASPAQRDFPKCLDERFFKLAAHAQEDVIGFFPGHGRLVGPMLDQRGKNVGYGEDPDNIRYASVLSLTFESQLVANLIHLRHGKRLDCT